MVSLSEDYQKTFEPHAATPGMRLRNIERLMEAGIRTEVRIDPVIPFVTDADKDFDRLFGKLSVRGITRASISALHLRPAIHRQMVEKLPPVSARLIETLFAGSDWRTVGSSTTSKLAPGTVRERIYDRAREIAGRYGVTLTVCACKNPDLPGELCTDPVDAGTGPTPSRRQMSLPLGGDETPPEIDVYQDALSR
jgi:DNA repair photolyase